jgi:hypothetical protein
MYGDDDLKFSHTATNWLMLNDVFTILFIVLGYLGQQEIDKLPFSSGSMEAVITRAAHVLKV